MTHPRVTIGMGMALLTMWATAYGQPTSANSIAFQAKLEGVAAPTVSLIVRFYDAAVGGNQVGSTITLDSVAVVNGVASVPVSPVDAAIFDGTTRFMGVSINGGAELVPRTLVTSVPYAARAQAGGDVQGVFRLDFGERRIEVNRGLGIGPDPAFGGALDTSAKPWLRTYTNFASGNDHDYVARFEFGDVGLGDSGVQLIKKNGGGDFHLLKCYYAGQDRFIVDQSGNVATNGNLYVGGAASASVLTIRGADVAERFVVADSEPASHPTPGMVVSIDAANPGKLHISSTPYDKRVAGAISGAGGLSVGVVMGKDNTDPLITGEHPVAMSGRVYVYCDATFGAIQPGDRLTTSSTPGHAMRVGDEPRAGGAVIGKAMTELKEGKGLVLVLVNLQ